MLDAKNCPINTRELGEAIPMSVDHQNYRLFDLKVKAGFRPNVNAL